MKILLYKNFNENEFGHGGEKRTAQIAQILKSNGVKYDQLIICSERVTVSEIIINFFRILYQIKTIIPIRTFSSVRVLIRNIKKYLAAEKAFKAIDISLYSSLIWESTRKSNLFIPVIAKKTGLKVISIPHNLESLVPNQISGITQRKAPEWFFEEINIFRKCDHVFCISKEETYVLKLFGVDSYYLPYYPSVSVFEYLLKIRKIRETKQNKGVSKKLLMLGSFDNQPTKIGMIDRVDFFNSNIINNLEIFIAGFHSENIKEEININNKNINILGTLNQEQLKSTLSDIDFVLIHQPPTSGALTRIVEFLICGINVIANFESSRSYFSYDGVITYSDDFELLKILEKFKLKPIAIPKKPSNFINLFIRIIR